MFKTNARKVDTKELNVKGYVDYDTFTTSRGGFMGDPLSFVQLSLQMQASLNAAGYIVENLRSTGMYQRPLGQGAGDDMIVLKGRFALYKELKNFFEETQMTVSKIDTWSEDAMMFCEQFALIPSDSASLGVYPDGSRFGDIFFLDIIKGSILSGKSKVRAHGRDPFIGHATMLNKQLRWHPIKWVKDRGKTCLWAANYYSAKKLSSNMASLPVVLGGIDLAIGRIVEWDDPILQKRVPYYGAILDLPFKEFLKYTQLLKGVYKANPKGIAWENNPELLREALEQLQVIPEQEVSVPLDVSRRGWRKIRRYLAEHESLIPMTEMISTLARREAFLNCWNEVDQTTYMSLPNKDIKEKSSKLWRQIYEEIEVTNQYDFKSIQELKNAYEKRSWGLLFKKTPEGMSKLFEGMPDLTIDYQVRYGF
jgi:hypothetical protein